MSTCKDCLCFGMCLLSSEKAGICEEFKDKSKFIELPCKVGEDLYRLKTINGKTIITTTQLNQNTLWRIVFGGEYGKSVFLTKKEAEQALAERSK